MMPEQLYELKLEKERRSKYASKALASSSVRTDVCTQLIEDGREGREAGQKSKPDKEDDVAPVNLMVAEVKSAEAGASEEMDRTLCTATNRGSLPCKTF